MIVIEQRGNMFRYVRILGVVAYCPVGKIDPSQAAKIDQI